MRIAAAVVGTTLAFFALTPGPLGLYPFGYAARSDIATRQAMEMTVMAFQVAAVLALAWSRLAPRSGAASGALLTSQVALGVAGSVCAGFESGFALFAGATLVVVLLGTILGPSGHGFEAGRKQFPTTANGC
jgi:hypothetical protein